MSGDKEKVFLLVSGRKQFGDGEKIVGGTHDMSSMSNLWPRYWFVSGTSLASLVSPSGIIAVVIVAVVCVFACSPFGGQVEKCRLR
jgi:hypothetical protein